MYNTGPEHRREACVRVNIKNLSTIYSSIFRVHNLKGAGITSQKTQFPAHLYNNQQHNLNHQYRLSVSLSQDSSQKTALKLPHVLSEAVVQ